MNKYFLLGTIAGLSLLMVVFGAWAKSTHQSYADTAMSIGKICQVVGLVALFVLLFMWLQKKK